MAATVTVTGSDFTSDISPPYTRTVNIAVASGDTRIVVLVTQGDAIGPSVINSITFDGSAMTEITGSPYTGSDWELRGYYLDISAKGAGTYAASIEFNANDPDDGGIIAFVLAGAGDPTNWVEDTDTGTAIDIAVTTAADGIALWAILQDVDTTLDPNGGETEVIDGTYSSDGGPYYYASAYYKATSGSTTTSNIGITSAQWRGVGVFVPAAGGDSVPRPSSDVQTTNWTSTGANFFGVIDEAVIDDNDYVTSPSITGAGQALICGLSNGPLAAGTWSPVIRASVSSGTATLRIKLLNDSNASQGQVDITVNTTPTRYDPTITTSGSATRISFEFFSA